MNAIRSYVLAHKTIVGIIAMLFGGLGWTGYKAVATTHTPASVLSKPDDRSEKSIEFVVGSGVNLANGGPMLLNNYEYKRGEQPPAGGLTVVYAGSDKVARDLKGKTVVATGHMDQFKGRPQFRASKIEVK